MLLAGVRWVLVEAGKQSARTQMHSLDWEQPDEACMYPAGAWRLAAASPDNPVHCRHREVCGLLLEKADQDSAFDATCCSLQVVHRCVTCGRPECRIDQDMWEVHSISARSSTEHGVSTMQCSYNLSSQKSPHALYLHALLSNWPAKALCAVTLACQSALHTHTKEPLLPRLAAAGAALPNSRRGSLVQAWQLLGHLCLRCGEQVGLFSHNSCSLRPWWGQHRRA